MKLDPKTLLVGGAVLLAAAIMAAEAVRPRIAPPLEYEQLLSGPAVMPSDGYVVVDFWATWCGPCVASIPHLNELATSFAEDNVQFLMVSAEDASTVSGFMTQRPIRATVAIDSDRSMFGGFGVRGIPHTFVISPEGKIVWDGHPARLSAEKLQGLITAG